MFVPENDGSFYGENVPGVTGTFRNHLSKGSLWTMIPFSSRNKNQNFALCLRLEQWPDVKSKMEFITVTFGWALFQGCPCASVLIPQIRSHIGISYFLSQYLSVECFRKKYQRSLNACSHGRKNRTWKTITTQVLFMKLGVCLALPRTLWSIISLLHNQVTRETIWELLPS